MWHKGRQANASVYFAWRSPKTLFADSSNNISNKEVGKYVLNNQNITLLVYVT